MRRSRCGGRIGTGPGKQRQGLFGFFRIEPAEREADVHDHVVADGDVVDECERDRLAHAVELDDGVVTGAGHVDVREGLLFQTKLFSGLSAILSKIIPDFTLFAQTDANPAAAS